MLSTAQAGHLWYVQQSLEVYDTQTVRIRSIRMDFLLPKIRSVRMSLEVYESMVKFFEIF